jgi:tRNA dimethylallyltransferase
MILENAHPPLVAVVGPTASGKSALGVWLAEQLGGEVVACDSTQLYRGFDIGTAKPILAERRGIPHHLIDVLGAEEAATAGGYRQMVLAVLADLRERARLPVFTVGTGLYLRALLEGLADIPQSYARNCGTARASMVPGTCIGFCRASMSKRLKRFPLRTSKN